MFHALQSKVDLLRDRAVMLARARAFFAERNVMEVDVPILSQAAAIDVCIDLVQARCCNKKAFLHSSPEYGMKRLLAENIGDIYQLSHVFRDHESGPRHNPEFMMAEWYRLGFTVEQLMDETREFVSLFFEDTPLNVEYMVYQEAFERNVGFFPQSIEERDEIFAFEIEPKLGREGLTFIYGFPPEQAALAQVNEDGLAERFELFFCGYELANGYHEFSDSVGLRKRFEGANQQRQSVGREMYPIDENFLAAQEEIIPDCCGVAVGFDRLMMLRHEVDLIDIIIPFAWEVS